MFQLRARQAGSNFVMQLDVCVCIAELSEKLIDVFRLNDVIDGVEIENAVTSRELVELLNHVIHSFRSELHSGTIQSTKGEVIFYSPPAAARGFDRQQNAPHLIGVSVTTLLSGVEVFIEIGYRSLIHVGEIGRAARV